MKTISTTYLKMIFNGCLEIGQDNSELENTLRNLLPDRGRNLDNPSYRYPRHYAATLLNASKKLLQDGSIGAKVGMSLRPQSLYDFGYAFSLCDDLRGVMALNHTYQPLIQQIGSTQLTTKGDSAWLEWTPDYSETEFYAQFVEMVFAGYASIGRWLLFGLKAPILSIHFRHTAPKNTDYQSRIFNDSFIYESDFDGMEVLNDVISIPMPNRNPELLSFLEQKLQVQLEQFNSPVTTTQEALRCIQVSLPEGRPSIGKTAKTLGMSERTLRRRLEAEGQTYSTLLEQARKEACEAYMRGDDMTQADIALQLGFNDQTAFSRAFKGWYNQTPTQYRQTLTKKPQIK